MTIEELKQRHTSQLASLNKDKEASLAVLQNKHYAYLSAFGGVDSNIPANTRVEMQNELKQFEVEWKAKRDSLVEQHKRELFRENLKLQKGIKPPSFGLD